mgnify:CR=1 FL=1
MILFGIEHESGHHMSVSIGIDFGTSSARVTCLRNDDVVNVPNKFSSGNNSGIIYYSLTGGKINFTSLKQKIGFEESVLIRGRRVLAIDLFSDVLRIIKKDSENYLKDEVSGAVIAVPSCFADKQRMAMRTAANKAGIENVKLIDESMAAVMALGINEEVKTILVYALGGGVFTVSAFRNKNRNFYPIWHEGDRNLGGNLFDTLVAEYLIREAGFDLSRFGGSIENVQNLKKIVEKTKIELFSKDVVEINFAGFTRNDYGDRGQDSKLTVARSLFEGIISSSVDQTISLTDRVIEKAGLTNDTIDAIVLVGGSTRIPFIEKSIRQKYNGNVIHASDDAISIGAAFYAKLEMKDTTEENTQQPDEKKKDEIVEPNYKPDKRTPQGMNEMSWLKEFTPYLVDSQLYWQNNEFDAAIAKLESLLSELPKFIANLYHSRGKLLLAPETVDEAIAHLEKGIEYDSDREKLRHSLHEAYSLKARQFVEIGNHNEARLILKKGLKYKPDCQGCLGLLKNIENSTQSPSHHMNRVRFKKKRR